MAFNKKILACESGATMVLVVLMATLLLSMMALAVDMARLYAVQAKVQSAADAALMGAVATADTMDYNAEMKRLFDANYPTNYMGSTVTVGDVVRETTPGGCGGYQYSVNVSVTAPTTIMNNMFGKDRTNFTATSKVFEGWCEKKLELTLVLDNTGSMANSVGGSSTSKIVALRQASTDLTNIIFGSASSLANVHISIVPFDTDVNIGSGKASWIQAGSVARYNSFGASNGFAANRNPDNPPNSAYTDFTDAPPTTEQTKFRVPPYNLSNTPNIYGPINGSYWCCGYPDFTTPTLAKMKFGMNNKSDILNTISQMAASGNTRINVGLMWGWFTLSPKWRGTWPEDSTLPADPAGGLSKQMVLMTDGLNTVWGNWYGSATSNDDTTTSIMCESIKAQGITLYTIGLGGAGDINEDLLRNCASRPTYYFRAPNSATLQTVFHAIGDQIIYNTLHLNQ